MGKLKTLTKKILAGATTATLLLSAFSALPSGSFSDSLFSTTVGAYTSLNDPARPEQDGVGVYQIASAENLKWFAALVNGELTDDVHTQNAEAVLTEDIVLDDNTMIGTANSPFKGVFDGGLHTVTVGYSTTDQDAEYTGLFAYTENATIKNVKVEGTITAYLNVGSVCGYAKGGTLSGCSSSVEIDMDAPLIEYAQGRRGGGLVAVAEGLTMHDCCYSGVLYRAYFGDNYPEGNFSGLIGKSDTATTINNCFVYDYYNQTAYGSSGYYSNGQDFYYISDGNAVVSNCYYYGFDFTQKESTGVEAADEEKISSGELAQTLRQNQTDGAIWGQDMSVLYPVGCPIGLGYPEVFKVTVRKSDNPNGMPVTLYKNKELNIGDLDNCGVSTDLFAVVTALTLNNVEYTPENIPVLTNDCDIIATFTMSQPMTMSDYVNITKEEEFRAFAKNLNQYKNMTVKLNNDITLPKNYMVDCSVTTKKWNDMEQEYEENSEIVRFAGTFDGNGKTITINCDHAVNATKYGLFAITEGAEIKDLTVNGTIKADTGVNIDSAAGLICEANNTKITNCIVDLNVLNVTGDFGGFIGTDAGSTIFNSAFVGRLSGCGNIGGMMISSINFYEDVDYNLIQNVNNYIYNSYAYLDVNNCTNVNSVYIENSNNSAHGTACFVCVNGTDSYTNNNDVAGAAKTAEEFANGTVAYGLSQYSNSNYQPDSGKAWGQELFGDNVNTLPVLGGTKVYSAYIYKKDEDGNYVADKTAHVNELSDILSDTPVVEGSFFDGWYKESECTNLWTAGDAFSDKDSFYLKYTKYTDAANVVARSISLNGDIAVNFYLSLDDRVKTADGSFIRFTYPNGTTQDIAASTLSGTKPLNVNGVTVDCYVVSINVAAKEMADVVKLEVFYGGEEIEENSYTVKQYAETIIKNGNNSFNENEIAVATAMLNYGANSQKVFNYNTDNLANSGLTDEQKNVSDVTESTFSNTDYLTYKYSSAKIGGLTYQGTSLLLESETTLRHYFKLSDGLDINTLTFKYTTDNSTYVSVSAQYNASKKMYYVDIENIAAKSLGDFFILRVEDSNSHYSIKYSPYNYVYFVLNDADSTNDMKDTVRSLYKYGTAAKTYFDNKNK